MATSRRSTPSPTVISLVCASPFLISGRLLSEEPSGPPLSLPSSAAFSLVIVHSTGAGVPTLASGTVWTAGSKATPSSDTSSWYGLRSSGEVRRASTSISQTPGAGSA